MRYIAKINQDRLPLLVLPEITRKNSGTLQAHCLIFNPEVRKVNSDYLNVQEFLNYKDARDELIKLMRHPALCTLYEQLFPKSARFESWLEIIDKIVKADPSAEILQREPEFLYKDITYTCDGRAVWMGVTGAIDRGFLLVDKNFEWFDAASLDDLEKILRRLERKKSYWSPEGFASN